METATITSKQELAANWDKEIRLVGEYYVQNLGRHAIIKTLPDGSIVKLRKAVFILLEDQGQVSLSTRPEEEMDALSGHKVKAIGTLNEAVSRGSREVARPNPVPFLSPIQSVEPIESS